MLEIATIQFPVGSVSDGTSRRRTTTVTRTWRIRKTSVETCTTKIMQRRRGLGVTRRMLMYAGSPVGFLCVVSAYILSFRKQPTATLNTKAHWAYRLIFVGEKIIFSRNNANNLLINA